MHALRHEGRETCRTYYKKGCDLPILLRRVSELFICRYTETTFLNLIRLLSSQSVYIPFTLFSHFILGFPSSRFQLGYDQNSVYIL
jgi:hypothetical protein